MSLVTEISRSVTGCYRFVRGDKQAFQYFNLSIEGFYRSFLAMALIIPVIIIYSLVFARMSEQEINLFSLVFHEMAISFVSWTIYLSALYMLARYFGVAGNFPTFVIVYNWSQVFFALIWLPLTVLAITLKSPSAMAIVSMIFISASYFYLWYIIMRSLAVATMTAVGFAVLEFLVSLMVRLTIGSF